MSPIDLMKKDLATLEHSYAEQAWALVAKNNAQPFEISRKRAITYAKVSDLLSAGHSATAIVAAMPPAALSDFIEFTAVFSLFLHIERLRKHIAGAEAAATTEAPTAP